VEQLGIDGRWFLSQLVNFIVLLIILQRFLYKPMLKMLTDRQERIRESMDYAERVKKEAERAERDYAKRVDAADQEAAAIITAARQMAKDEAEKIMAAARVDAERLMQQEKQKVEYERKRAMDDARKDVEDLALKAAERVLGSVLGDESTQRRVVQDFLAETGKFN
jgi:F-type H+-transporting ATPase subunit b